jgi:hypothetical protein
MPSRTSDRIAVLMSLFKVKKCMYARRFMYERFFASIWLTYAERLGWSTGSCSGVPGMLAPLRAVSLGFLIAARCERWSLAEMN